MKSTGVRERPINLKSWEVRAILDGRKTQLRRIIKPQPRTGRLGPNHPIRPSGIIGPVKGQFGDGDYCVWDPPTGPQKGSAIPWTEDCWYRIAPECPLGERGDRLWGREAFHDRADYADIGRLRSDRIVYVADGAKPGWIKHSPVRMPRWASRITLEIAEVRVQRVQDISEDDAAKDGFDGDCPIGYIPAYDAGPLRYHLAWQWQQDNGDGSWSSNPWVWAVSFRKIDS